MHMSTDHPRPEDDEMSYHLESPSPDPPSSEPAKHDLEEQVAHITPRFPPAREDVEDDDTPTLKMPLVRRKKPPSDTSPVSSIQESQFPAFSELPGSLPSVPLLTTRERDLLHSHKYRQLYLRRLSRKRIRRAREASR